MAPNTFARVNQATAVVQQPEGQQGRQQALQALLACPTYDCVVKRGGIRVSFLVMPLLPSLSTAEDPSGRLQYSCMSCNIES